MTLGGVNTYAGPTVVSQGLLQLTPLGNPVTGGLLYDLDPSLSANYTLTSGNVTQLNDVSGHGNNFANAASTVTVVNGGKAFNGLNVLNFSGGTSATLVLSNTTSPVTLFVVEQVNGITVNGDDGIIGRTGADMDIRANPGPVILAGAGTDVHDFTYSGSGGSMYVNGVGPAANNITAGTAQVLLAYGGGNSTGPWASTSLSNSPIAGQNRNFDGYMGEVLAFSTSLSAAQAQAVDAYLMYKWLGIGAPTSNLPSTTVLTVGSSGTFDLGGWNQTVVSLSDLNGSGGTVQNSNSFASVLTLNTSAGAPTTYSGVIAGGNGLGSISLTVTGNGSQNLSGANTYNGGTRIAGAAVLQLGNTGALGTGGVTVNSGTLNLDGLGNVSVPSFSGSNGVVSNSASGTLSTLTVAQTAPTTFSGSLRDGAGQLGLAVSGGLALAGSSTYSGGTTIVAGTLQARNDAALGSVGGNLTVDTGGQLDVNGHNLGIGGLGGNGTIDNVGTVGAGTLTVGNGNASGNFTGSILSTSGALALVKTGTGQPVLSGVNTYAGGTFLNGGLLTFSPNSIPYSQSSSFTFGGGTLQWATGNAQDISAAFAPIGSGQTAFIEIDDTNNPVAFGSSLSGSGGLTKLGLGLLTLNASNSYSGTTTVSGGTLQLGVANALPVGALRVRAGFLDLDGQGATVTRLSGSGSTAGGTILSSNLASTLTVNQATASTFGGALQDGSGGLNFTLSAGTLTLTGTNNTYSRSTTINGGILKAGAASTLSQWSNMLIGPAGTLDATNFNQTVSSLSVSGALNLTIGNLLNVSNAASFAAGSTLNLFGTPSGGTDELISYGSLDPINNSFTNLTLGGGSLAANDLHYSPAGLSPGLYYYVSSVGGPSTWSFAGSGTWSTPTNWSPAGAPSASGTAVLNNAAAANVSVVLDVSSTLSKLVMGNADLSSTSGFAITAIGANGLTFNNSGGTSQITVTGGSQSITAPITMVGSLNIAPSAGSVLTINGNLTESPTGSLASLNVIDAGMLVLTGTNNNYTGGTFVSAGTLNVTNAGAIPVGDNVTVGAGGTWIFGSLEAGGPISSPISGTMVSTRGFQRCGSAGGGGPGARAWHAGPAVGGWRGVGDDVVSPPSEEPRQGLVQWFGWSPGLGRNSA